MSSKQATSNNNGVNNLDSSANNQFKVLFVYSNSPMDNLMPVSVSSLAGALRQHDFDIRLFDTTYYPMHDLSSSGADRQGSLQVAEFSYKDP